MNTTSTRACRPGVTSTRRSVSRGEYARDEDGDGFCEVHVNTMEGVWSLLRSWLRPHRGISQEKLPLYLGFFEFVHNARRRGKALLSALLAALVR
jgi:transposase